MQHERRKQIFGPFGYDNPDAPPDHSSHGIYFQEQPSPGRLEFCYREWHGGYMQPSVGRLWRGPGAHVISLTNPPPFDTSMVSVRVDMQGKLIELPKAIE